MRTSRDADDPLSLGRTSLRLSSFKRRFTTFLSTALRWYFGTTRPTLARGSPEDKKKTSRWDVFLLFPLRRSSRISRVLVIRLEGGNLKPAGDSAPGQASPTSYFEPTVTTSRRRPCRRRRLRVSRPPLVRMRARNPCLFFRFRFRGLYVGIMGNHPPGSKVTPEVELCKIPRKVLGGQPRTLVDSPHSLTGPGEAAEIGRFRPAPTALSPSFPKRQFDFSSPQP
jgi:hypothetical protein